MYSLQHLTPRISGITGPMTMSGPSAALSALLTLEQPATWPPPSSSCTWFLRPARLSSQPSLVPETQTADLGHNLSFIFIIIQTHTRVWVLIQCVSVCVQYAEDIKHKTTLLELQKMFTYLMVSFTVTPTNPPILCVLMIVPKYHKISSCIVFVSNILKKTV